MIRIALSLGITVAAASGAAAETQGEQLDLELKKLQLIQAMQDNGCKMTTAQAHVEMPKLGIDRSTAIKLSREMMANGIVAFADDEETLLLLRPACKT